MAQFSNNELQELAEVFGLTFAKKEQLPVRDGYVMKGEEVWWRGEKGPKRVLSSAPTHWENIRNYPEYYQLKRPRIKQSFAGYLD